MIVEDDEIIRNLITTMLQRKGYSIAGESGSGEEAIVMAAEVEPDLVLMDITLSGKMDGVAAARFIYQLFRIPIVFLTAHCDDNLIERAKSAQPLGYILKPFTDKDLVSNVGLALYNHGVRKKFLDPGPVGDPKKLITSLELVLVMDSRGILVYFNPYAARILELPSNEILSHYWREVLMLINDQTGEEVPDPVPEVIRQKLVVIHEFNTAMVCKNGKTRKVSATIRPIKDDNNEFIGIFMYIKEKTPDQIKMAAVKK
jgi:PAS domain S-box-containing protein